MNTPAHAIINLLLAGKTNRKQYALPIVIGALLPDFSMFLFYVWEKYKGVPESIIWNDLYHQPAWQALFNTFHLFPFLALACFAAWRAQLTTWAVLFASMFAHSIFDFPVHHNDAHQHFFPFSDYQFISPISYWDPAHYGLWIGGLELLTVVAGSVFILRQAEKRTALKRSVLAIASIYLIFWGFALVIWL